MEQQKGEVINRHGDRLLVNVEGLGADIASQRTDDLDLMCLEMIERLRLQGGSVNAADVGCGMGAHAVLMNQIGAHVVAIDLAERAALIDQEISANTQKGVPDIKKIYRGGYLRLHYVQSDMRHFCSVAEEMRFDVIYSQRAIHYLMFEEAMGVVQQFRSRMRVNGYLFLSASGLKSELGDGYAAKQFPVNERYHPLSPAMSQLHGIQGRVCLYTEEDMRRLLEEAGFKVIKVYSSKFGNVKAIAQNP